MTSYNFLLEAKIYGNNLTPTTNPPVTQPFLNFYTANKSMFIGTDSINTTNDIILDIKTIGIVPSQVRLWGLKNLKDTNETYDSGNFIITSVYQEEVQDENHFISYRVNKLGCVSFYLEVISGEVDVLYSF